MNRREIVVIDYGVGNLLSVRRGLEHCGASVVVSEDHDLISRASKVVLPGVGAFADGMQQLRERGLDRTIRDIAAKKVPLLGICLGMQMLFDVSEEFGLSEGLGLIPGSVIPVPKVTEDHLPQKIPHIGWNALVQASDRNGWSNTLLEAVRPGEAAYFVHSFMACPSSNEFRIADCMYGGHRIAAAVSRGSVFGFQFHPEKSGEVGLKTLRSFVSL
jgi:glutamine amidotransferase